MQAAFLGDDWTTEGDWVGRYGRQYALLLAMHSPRDQTVVTDTSYRVAAMIGPHHLGDDDLRHWITWEHPYGIKYLYSPVIGHRRQAEADDHGETYNMSFEGPDIWIDFSVPAGVHRVSLYFHNPNGHDVPTMYRDYVLELKAWTLRLEDARSAPTLARARVKDVWNPVYKQFLVSGPRRYYLRIGRNGSFNTLCSGIFFDRLPVKSAQSSDPAPV